MTKRPSIADAVERETAPPKPPPHARSPGRRRKSPEPAPASTREGKVAVAAFFPPEVRSSLHLVQAKRGGKLQDVMGEALNLLFAKYNVPETAPVPPPEHG